MSIVYQVRSGALSGFLPLVSSLQGDVDGLLAGRRCRRSNGRR